MKENGINRKKVKVQYLFMAAALAAVVLPGFESKRGLELADLKNDGSFCYRDLDWQDRKKDVEEKLGIEFDKPILNTGYGTKIYQNENGVMLFDIPGTENYTFDTEGLENVEIIFSQEEGSQNLEEFEKKICDELTELYGAPEYTLEREALYPLVSEGTVKFRKSRWMAETGEESEVGTGESLYIQADMDEDSAVKYVRLVVERSAPKISENELEDLDLAAFKNGDIFSYDKLEWGSSPAQVEEKTGRVFENPVVGIHDPEVGNGVYYRVKYLNYYGFVGAEHYDFMRGGLRQVGVAFGTKSESLDLTELETRVVNDLKKLYGEDVDTLETDGGNSGSQRKMRMYKWDGPEQEGILNNLWVVAYLGDGGRTVQLDIQADNDVVEVSSEPDPTSEVLKLTELKKDDLYTYRGIEWGCTPEELEEIIGIRLGEPDNFGQPADGAASKLASYSNVRSVRLFKNQGKEKFSFYDNKLIEASVVFDSDVDFNLKGFGETIIQMLENEYGKDEEVEESEIASGDKKRTVKQYKWKGKDEDGYINRLLLICTRNEHGMTEEVQITVSRQPVDTK